MHLWWLIWCRYDVCFCDGVMLWCVMVCCYASLMGNGVMVLWWCDAVRYLTPTLFPSQIQSPVPAQLPKRGRRHVIALFTSQSELASSSCLVPQIERRVWSEADENLCCTVYSQRQDCTWRRRKHKVTTVMVMMGLLMTWCDISWGHGDGGWWWGWLMMMMVSNSLYQIRVAQPHAYPYQRADA